MIVSRGNETLKAIRRLRRRQGDQALLEGPHLVHAAIDAALELESVLVAPSFADSPTGRRLLDRLRRPPLTVAGALLDELADADSPRGLLALARLPRNRIDRLAPDPEGTYLYLDGVQDPGNLGALARVAEAFGARALLLAPGCCHPNHPRALRASAGSLLRVGVAVEAEVDDVDSAFFDRPPVWVALAAHGGAALGSGARSRPLVLALGAEGPGLSPAVEGRARMRWTIPLAGRVESLNVAVAAGIALHALGAAGGPDRP